MKEEKARGDKLIVEIEQFELPIGFGIGRVVQFILNHQ